ncbi:MAG: MFS transporter [Spirochaetae bacterium HGW-Spirochaetae-5]|nr:MAG: MFS transporter [Spirochaetae bacterium HGW-Spirochaetae-5]
MGNKSFMKFLVLWTGQLLSSLGSGMTAFALGVYVFRKTGSATDSALIILFLFLPSIILKPLGGVLADRFDRRVMIIIGDTGSAGGVLFLMITMLTGDINLLEIYSGVAIISTFAALQNPAWKASITDLLTEDQFSRGSGLMQLASSAQHLISPVMAGLLMSITDIKTILLIDLVSFFTAILSVLVIKKSLTPAEKNCEHSLIHDFREGWRSVTSNNGVMLLIAVISIVTFFIGFLQTLLGPMILSFTDAGTLGISQSAAASGMLLSSLILGIIAVTCKHTFMFTAGLVLAGGSFSLIGVTTNIYFITGAAFLFFCSLPLVNTSADVLIRKNIPNEIQGRAWGIIGVLSQIGFIAAYGISGLLADNIFNPIMNKDGALAASAGKIIGTGPGRGIGLMFVISGICVVITAVMTIRIRSVRNLEKNDLLAN